MSFVIPKKYRRLLWVEADGVWAGLVTITDSAVADEPPLPRLLPKDLLIYSEKIDAGMVENEIDATKAQLRKRTSHRATGLIYLT